MSSVADVVGSGLLASKTVLKKCSLEVGGLALLSAAMVALRMRGTHTTGMEDVDDEAWEQIAQEWPLLVTADSLLAAQVLLKVLICVSLLLRTESPKTPSLGALAVLWCLGHAARLALVCRSSHYMLDGPLGGNIPVGGEVAVFLTTLCLGWRTACKHPLCLAFASAVLAWFASRNRLNLAEDPTADSLFVFAHTAEIMAAVAYSASAVLVATDSTKDADSDECITAGFTHFLMFAQHLAPAYYFTTAFPASPEMNGAGQPFMLLQYGNLACVAVLLASFVIYAVMHLDDESQ
jgi:hypothetical protein